MKEEKIKLYVQIYDNPNGKIISKHKNDNPKQISQKKYQSLPALF